MADEKRLSDDLFPASFRDIPFLVESTGFQAGRRVQVHEYPQRDMPYVEDLGRATRELDFSAVLVGEDYVEQANDLIEALEAPGVGTLVHPWFGEMQVYLRERGSLVLDGSLGRATVQLAFVESGELEFPLAVTSTQQETRECAAALETSAIDDFIASFNVQGFQDFVAAAASGNLASVLGLSGLADVGKLLGFATSVAPSVSTLVALISYPSALGYKLMGMFGLSGIATTVAAWGNVVQLLSGSASGKGMRTPPRSRTWTPSRNQADKNAAAIYGLTRQAMLVQAIGASSLVGTKVDSGAQPVASYTDMMSVRDALIAAIDAESLVASDRVYLALQDARAAVWQDLTTRARNNARLDELTPTEVLPAVVISYDYYGSALRDAEIVARNRIRHPGFVPPLPLKVMTK